MTYVQPFTKITFGGTTAGNEEIWSCGISLVQDDSGTTREPLPWFTAVSAQIDDVALLLKSYFEQTDLRVPAGVTIGWVKMALIDVDGKYMTDAVEAPVGTTGQINAAYSPQDAVAVGLQSDVWKDPGRNNRFYLPTVGPADTNAWHLSGPEQTNIATRTVQLIQGINALYVDEPTYANSYIGVVSNAGTGHQNAVERVRVGRIVDTQRRRRNQLSENYISIPNLP